MKNINVETGSGIYRILIGDSIFTSVKSEIEKLKLNKNIFIIADENVKKYHTEKILQAFGKGFPKVIYYSLKQGEKSKSALELNKIYFTLLKNNFGRDTLIVAIGGGVTGDLAGFAASTYMRGVQLIHIPTTLLADVDSAVGGKTGINFQNKKNIIGTFYQPELVVIDSDFLETLPASEFKSGVGEIVKYAFITNKNFYKVFFNNLDKIKAENKQLLSKLIYESIQFKASVVSLDEKENGPRKILNFGHTFAHAFESATNFRIKHGEAVIAGVIAALYLSNKVGLLKSNKLNEFLKDLSGLSLTGKLKKIQPQKVIDLMKHDKKNREGKIKFILLKDIGEIYTDYEVESVDIISALNLTFQFI